MQVVEREKKAWKSMFFHAKEAVPRCLHLPVSLFTQNFEGKVVFLHTYPSLETFC